MCFTVQIFQPFLIAKDICISNHQEIVKPSKLVLDTEPRVMARHPYKPSAVKLKYINVSLIPAVYISTFAAFSREYDWWSRQIHMQYGIWPYVRVLFINTHTITNIAHNYMNRYCFMGRQSQVATCGRTTAAGVPRDVLLTVSRNHAVSGGLY